MPLCTVERLRVMLVTLLLSFAVTGELKAVAVVANLTLAQTQTAENQEDEADRLLTEGKQKLNQREFPAALEAFEQALALYRQAKNRKGEGNTLYSIGDVYYYQTQFAQAIEFYQQALVIRRELKDRTQEATTLNDIGLSYSKLSQYAKALEYYQQALAIRKQIGDRSREGTNLSNIGFLLDTQKQPELAIVFFKQSVNVREKIRQDLRVLPKEQQESYTKTVAHSYRRLADLLLQQDRVLEAQQVLDLLKIQELDNYLRNVRGTGQQLIILRPEQEILQKYNVLQNSAIQLGQELTKLRKIPETTRTTAQQQKIAQLVQLEEELNKQFNQFIHSPDVVKLVNQLSREVKLQNIDLADLDAFRDDLRRLNAVMLYPLILDDRLELVIITPDAPPLRRPVKVKREELNQVIADFRSALEHRDDNVKIPAQKLYNWLIKPLEADLKQAKATTIIYASDGQLRYIPLAALYDGNQWLVQNYRINNITAKSLTNFNNVHQSKLKVLAGAFADIKLSYSVRIGQEEHSLRGLPFAGQEVANLAVSIADTTQFLDKDFSLEAMKPRMNEFNIVHLATHAAFVPGQPEDSFILFGNGDRPTLRDIESWTLNNVDLVVLSACETGIGGKFGNGEEILGLGYQFQSRGARAAIASLWSVNDGGTQALMNVFYAQLIQGNLSKTEALRQAQIALITGRQDAAGKQRNSIEIEALPSNVSDKLSHPYYWAAFILIGNGL
ncbi:CHAT domain-containing protein [Nostoc sp. NZL]|uniref:CHAT domain-containing protein n=1 Tax=Nostoc sp. NZL TaxID=2650612 RepID=UPI0018C75247|nr:CHAT domain-containing protein [Nostoc sp. NZL]MBG1240501.1 CHAT domain-containing protein [Nostoc sp. NZL]